VIEVGVDEAGRGPLIGRVYAAAVIWPPELKTPLVRDSKKYSKKSEREQAYEFIIENAIAYGIAYVEPEEIDRINIYKAVMASMHTAIRNTNINPDHILVDGNSFKPYIDQWDDNPGFTTVVQGDSKYYSIAAASVLAKVEHDRYITQLCQSHPALLKYDLLSNMGYGTTRHMEAIRQYGVTQFHRRSFACCRDLPVIHV